MKKTTKKFSFRDIYIERKRALIAKLVKREMHKNFTQGYSRVVGLSFDMMLSTINIKGLYEKEFLEILVQWLYTNNLIRDSAVDVGANIGNHTVFFSKYYEKIFSFEPHPLIFKILCLNAEINSSKIHCFNVGVSSENRQARFHTPHKTHVSSSKILKESSVHNDDFLTIDLVSLDTVNELNKEKIGLLKIDVEGHELEVLNGAEKLITKNYPVILFEQKRKDFKLGSSDCINLLKNHGYSFFRLIYSPDRGSHLGTFKRASNFVKSLLFGSLLTVASEDKFPPSNYNFIIAVHEKENM